MSASLLRHDEPPISATVMTVPAAHISARDSPSDSATSPWKDQGGKQPQQHMAPPNARPKKKIDKKSPEYLWKSLVAGGLAGCAVCIHPTAHETTN